MSDASDTEQSPHPLFTEIIDNGPPLLSPEQMEADLDLFLRTMTDDDWDVVSVTFVERRSDF